MSKLRLPMGSDGRTSSARLFNCFAEGGGDKGPVSLLNVPGVNTLGTLPSTAYRGARMHNGLLYVVAGNTLYSVTRNGTATSESAIAGSGRVTMASNRDALVIGTNSTDYVFDGALTPITDPDFVDSSLVDVIDSYAVWLRPSTDQIASSGLANSDDYDALDFATAEATPDKLVGHIVDHNQWILFGEETTEIWWNAGNTGFPFERIGNGVIEHGCIASRSIAKADSGVFWLDDDRIIRRLVGIQAQKVSTHAIDELVREQPDAETAYGFTYSSDGHIFYCLTFDGLTVCYDAATGQWHERRSLNQSNWRVADVVSAYNRYMAFDTDTGKFGFLDETAYTEFDEEIQTAWRYPVVYAEGRTARHNRLEIMLDVGGAALGETAVVGLRVSDDGGKTFDELPTRSIGLTGEYLEAPLWTKLGSSRNRVYEPWISDNVRRLVVDTQLEVVGGRL